MKKNKNTIEGVDINVFRKAGNSTRQIDAAINHLFNGLKVEVKDHWKDGTDKKCNIRLFERIIDRLESEHDLFSLRRNKMIDINRQHLTLELI